MDIRLHTMFSFSLLAAFCLIISHYPQPAYSAEQFQQLELTIGDIAPDNYIQPAFLINGAFPGPEIRCLPNTTLEVLVVNRLYHGVTIHFHGILQRASVSSDGVPHVTQDLILPNQNFTYIMNLSDQSGTFMYHAHTGLDLVWALGLLVIQESDDFFENHYEEYEYDEERTVLISQCWHVPTKDIEGGIEGQPFEDVPDTDSILINGRSFGSWNESNSENFTTGYDVIAVKQGGKYRFRVIGMGMDSMLTFSIQSHKMVIIEVDGILVDPVETDILYLNSAQRYSVIVEANQPIGNYLMTSKMIPGPGPRNGMAILHYETGPEPNTRTPRPGETEELEFNSTWIEAVLDNLHPSSNVSQSVVYPVPEKVDREITITSYQHEIDNYTKFDINGVIHRHDLDDKPLLRQSQAGVDISADPKNGVFNIHVNENIQIVFQNRMSTGGECEQHPWHSHGHTFYVVGRGADLYNSTADSARIQRAVEQNGETFLFRDVATMWPNQTVENTTAGVPCGWMAIRFIADNPGLWLVHCHITPHQMMGKYFILHEYPELNSGGSAGPGYLAPPSYVLFTSLVMFLAGHVAIS